MKQYNVLVVDDVAKNIQVLGSILSADHYRVAYATNGQDALKLVGLNNFDCILLDVMMPGMDGFEVCRLLKQNPRTTEIPVIFLTAKNDQESVLKGFQLGAQDYVTKPFSSPELIIRVKTHIELMERRKELVDLNLHLEDKVHQRTLELEKANRQLANLENAKSEFLNIISHELRTPLNGITGLTSLLDQTLLDREQQEYITFLKQASNRLVRFSDIALLITSLQTKNSRFELLPSSIEVLFEMAIDAIEPILNEKNIQIETLIDIPGLRVLCDADLIRKSIELIVENAISNLGDNSKIWIEAFDEGGKTHISVRDNGPGFADDLLFNVKNDLAAGGLTTYESLGLSLAAVKLIMKIHNGHITVGNNIPSGGAFVTLSFEKSN
jgi:two-component system, sensor histidine kinase and response regulator